MISLYLTATERQEFAKLPAEIRTLWGDAVITEEGQSYETAEELQMRRVALEEESRPDTAALLLRAIEELETGAWGNSPLLSDFPPELLPDLFFALGATGLERVIATTLPVAQSPADLEAVALLSQARHALLETNAQA